MTEKVMFYAIYIDSTLLIFKKRDIDVLNKFNSFDKNLKFTINTCENCVLRFLDITIWQNVLGNYHKHTQTGQYVCIKGAL